MRASSGHSIIWFCMHFFILDDTILLQHVYLSPALKNTSQQSSSSVSGYNKYHFLPPPLPNHILKDPVFLSFVSFSVPLTHSYITLFTVVQPEGAFLLADLTPTLHTSPPCSGPQCTPFNWPADAIQMMLSCQSCSYSQTG